jgi:hypothetical protein
MPSISTASWKDIQALLAEIDGVTGFNSCEELAKKYASIFYTRFSESIVLARIFATVPFGKLPDANKRFVTSLALTAGVTEFIKDHTPVLSLIGTAGANPNWNDRRRSVGHMGIPLASGHFIGSIPMMSRLLKQLGMDLGWIDKWDAKIIGDNLSRMGGTFYVKDAGSELDSEGRKIIASQDFVTQNKVRTVFGFGGGYLATSDFAVFIVFTRETLEKAKAEQFQVLVGKFKAATTPFVARGKVFAL